MSVVPWLLYEDVGGATIVAEPLDEHGMRFYRALDTEGHRWVFARMLPTQCEGGET